MNVNNNRNLRTVGTADLEPLPMEDQQINDNRNQHEGIQGNPGLQRAESLANWQAVGENFLRDNPQPNENLRGAVNGTGVKAFFNRIGAWLTSVFSRPERTPVPDEVRVDAPWNDEVIFTGKELESMVDDVPDARRNDEITQLEDTLSNRLQHGWETLRSVLNGERNGRPATQQEAADVMLCLHARAKSFGEGFVRGAYSVEDPEGRLADFLAASPESYIRKSSHLKGLQSENPHRGIDMPSGMGGIPNGMRTMLFGVIPEANGRSRRLFIKPEEFGCRLFRPSNASSLGASRGIRLLHDLKNSAGHIWTTVRSWFVNGENTRKERIPGDITTAFKELVQACKEAGEGELAATLTRNSPLESHQGIRTIKANLAAANLDDRIRLGVGGLHENGEIDNRYTALVRQLDVYSRLVDGKRGDVLARIGDEVMLELADFNG